MNYYDAEELACAILDLDYDELVNEGRENEIDEALYEKYEIGLDQFIEVARDLLRCTYPIKNGLTDTFYHAFGVQDDEIDAWRAICKEKV